MDIDLDFGSRTNILNLIQHVPAAMIKDNRLVKHVSGVYVNNIPYNSVSQTAAIEYQTAEELGYVKLDFLNVTLYQQISSPAQLDELMQRSPNWTKLLDPEFCAQIIHIGNHYSTLRKMPEPIDSIEKMAMFLAVIRPAKRHLIGRKWAEVAKTVWKNSEDGSYTFRKAHGFAYAHLVAININLLDLSN